MKTLATNETVSFNLEAAQTDTVCSTANQRSWMRLSTSDEQPLAIVSGSAGLKTAAIEDISMGGVGLRVTDDAPFVVGQPVEIEFQEQVFGAIVRYKVDHSQGGHRIGLEWTQPSAPALQVLMKYLLAE